VTEGGKVLMELKQEREERKRRAKNRRWIMYLKE